MKRRLLALLLGLALQAQAETLRFAVIGDTPYDDRERRELPGMLTAIADQGMRFMVHVGDIKNGRDRCDDALYADRHALFNASRIPFVYVPGDNEWTDCHRLSNGSYNPVERLAYLRQHFFSEPQSLGQTRIAYTRQSAEFPEHARFRVGPVLFVMINLPGSDNNRGSLSQPSEEYRLRNPAVLSWLRENFALARQEAIPAIALIFQANPGFRLLRKGLFHPGYADFLIALQQEVKQFPGEVLAIHGDTHTHRADHPLNDSKGKVLGNFTRLESYGAPYPGWIEVAVDAEKKGIFSFEFHPWTGH